jgi:4-amino-4-deoxy-L-arabinose transferase-like glycosyltransferase
VPFGLAELAREEPFAPVDAILAADRQSGLYMVLRENVERFLAPFDHRGPIYTYLTAVPVLVAPWTVLFLAAAASLAAAWRRATPDARWILEANAIVLVLFSLSGSRRSYYILPILPFCALLTAIRFAEVGHDGLSRLVLRITMVVLVAAASLAAAAAVAAPLVQQVSGLPFPLELRLFALVVGLCALLPWLAGRPTRAHVADALGVDRDVVAHLLSATLLIGSYFCVAQPILDRYRTEKPFALALREEVQDLPPERIAFLTHAPAFFPFYLGLSRPARVLSSSDELGRFVRSGEGVVILSRKKVAALEGALPAELAVEPLLAEPIQPWERRTGKKWLAWRVGRDR